MAVSRSGGLAASGPWAGSPLMGAGASTHLNGLATTPQIAPATFPGVSRAGGFMAPGRWGGSAKTGYVSVPPQIDHLVPANGASIYKNTLIEFDITDSIPLVLTEIQVDQATREVVYDGDAFLAPYQGSQRTPIPGGWHYVVIRYGGWTASPVFHVRALDTALNQGVLGP